MTGDRAVESIEFRRKGGIAAHLRDAMIENMYEICGVDLVDIQREQTRILKAFDAICREHDLRYSIEGGTLLGAYKYQGFVPWDDDIDVVMPREDYEKFLVIAQGIDNGMTVHTYKNDRYMLLNYCKYRMKGTVYKERLNAHLDQMDHGLFMDIFPLDRVIPEKLEKHKKKMRFYFKIRWSKLGYRKGGLIDRILRIVPHAWVIKRIEKTVTRYNRTDSPWLYEICNSSDKFAPIPRAWFDDLVDLEFNGIKVKAVREYQAYIAARFGDVTGLPPEEERKPSHQIIEVRLSDEHEN